MPEGIKPGIKPLSGADEVDAAILEKTARAQQGVYENQPVINFYDKDDRYIGHVKWTPQNDKTYVRPYPAPSESSKAPDVKEETNDTPPEAPPGLFGQTAADLEAAQKDMDAELAKVSDASPATSSSERDAQSEKANDEPAPAAASDSTEQKPAMKKISLSLGGGGSPTQPPQTPESSEPSPSKKKRGPETPLPPPPPPPLEEKPLSDRVSNVKSPFRSTPRMSEPILPGPDAYAPNFIPSSRHEALGEPPSMREILDDPKKQELFGIFVESTGDRGRALVKKFMESAMTDTDHAELQMYRIEFHRRASYAQEVRERTTPADIEFMLHNHAAFTFLRNSIAPARAAEIIKIHMDKEFMRMSNEQLTRVTEASRANHDIWRSDYLRDLYQSIEKKKNEASPDERLPTFDSIRDKSPAERQKMLDFLKPSFMQEVSSLIQGISSGSLFSGAPSLSVDNSKAALESIDLNRENIMYVLAATISNDMELKRAVADEAIHGIRVREAGEDVLTLEDAQDASINVLEGQIGDTEDLRRRIRDAEFRKKVGVRAGKFWEDMDPEEREKLSYEQLQDEKVLPKPRRGFFSLWLSSIFDAAFPDMQKKLANEFEDEK
jgi:hypothetical protein